MEICRCEEYQQVVHKFSFFTCGTLHELVPRETIPENCTIKWVKNKASYHDPRCIKPVLIRTSVSKESEIVPDLETKWIPVLPGLISLKIINQDKSMKRLLF
ncbi:hypothetical protein TcasGA2_TC011091 [Tribolium castaneum]|uniref:Uncharacterized protein n=1 Tax=Tribolium castaneum TaxID=7070 RepID=D6X4C9_TRICA|nr:hypothetical protein TcasGA2_TC011091 [Tribolium castaneum]